jgi:hypothetical protein
MRTARSSACAVCVRLKAIWNASISPFSLPIGDERVIGKVPLPRTEQGYYVKRL